MDNNQFFENLLGSRTRRHSPLETPKRTSNSTTTSRKRSASDFSSGVYISGKKYSSQTSASATSTNSNISRNQILDVFDITLPNSGMTLLVGSPSSGVNDILTDDSNTYRIRGGQFATNETYNSVVGAAAGYVGSDKTSPFVQFLSENKTGTVYIDGIENAGASQLSDFVSMIQAGQFIDKTGNLPSPVSVQDFQFIFVLHERISADSELTSSVLSEKLYKLVKSDRSPMVVPELIENSQIYHLYDFLDRPEAAIHSLSRTLDLPTPARLQTAISTFFLTNTEVFEIAASALRIQITDDFRSLYSEDVLITKQRIFSKDDYREFQEKLETYHGQEEASTAFSDALALKVQQHLPRPTSLFCVGPPGIGKTEIAKRLGSAVDSFVRIDGNVISSASDLFGSERGPGQLTQKLTKGAPAVILFDEAEKMDRSTVLSLLQLLDEGLINDQFSKETWPLQEAIIVFTSNAIKDPNITSIEARSQLSEIFPQEFVDRLDFLVPFRYFSEEQRKEIAQSFADASSITLSTDELSRVATSQSIRQIQLDVQRISASRASEQLNRELGRSLRR